MGILQKQIHSDFTVVHNAFIRDGRLSMAARGLLLTMLSLPDSWNFSIKGLSKILPEGEYAISSTLKKLGEFGYFKRERITGSDGRVVDWSYNFSDEPIFLDQQSPPQRNSPHLKNSDVADRDVEKSDVGNSGVNQINNNKTKNNQIRNDQSLDQSAADNTAKLVKEERENAPPDDDTDDAEDIDDTDDYENDEDELNDDSEQIDDDESEVEDSEESSEDVPETKAPKKGCSLTGEETALLAKYIDRIIISLCDEADEGVFEKIRAKVKG